MGAVVKVPSRGPHLAWPGDGTRLRGRSKLASLDTEGSEATPSGARAEPYA
jgi:hypothetical protein